MEIIRGEKGVRKGAIFDFFFWLKSGSLTFLRELGRVFYFFLILNVYFVSASPRNVVNSYIKKTTFTGVMVHKGPHVGDNSSVSVSGFLLMCIFGDAH